LFIQNLLSCGNQKHRNKSSEAVIRQRKKVSSNIPLDLIASDVLDHYRTYSHLEKFLDCPQKLDSSLSFQLEKASKMHIIDRYYSLDDSVGRELLGKKLSSKYRKDLDEISDRTNIKLKSCRRQFDNIKRIQKCIEEGQPAGSLLKIIQREFLLSEELARKYCVIVFIANQRFELSKKKLSYLSFKDFYECTNSIMNFWTYCYQHSQEIEEEFDKEFLLDLRELRCLFDKEREIKQ
jgi:Acidic fibroblast growth factor binding (FIBP)